MISLSSEPIPRLFFTKVAGVTHENDDGTERQFILALCRDGEPLILEREPANPVDPEGAVAVFRMNGEKLGYIPRHVSRGGDASGS